MRVYFILRKLSLTLRGETEKYLPLTNTQNCVNVEDNLDLSKFDFPFNSSRDCGTFLMLLYTFYS